VLAAGIAFYWSRQSAAQSGSSSNKTTVEALPGGGHIRGNATAIR